MNFCRFHRRVCLSSAIAFFLLFFPLLTTANQAAELPVVTDTSALLKKRVTEAGIPPKLMVRNERLLAAELLAGFYQKLNYRPVWIGLQGPLDRVESFVDAISRVGEEGLIPEHYHLSAIISLFSEISAHKEKQTMRFSEMLTDLELLLSDAYLLLGCHFSAGCIDPVTLQAEWFIRRDELDITSVFERALREDRIQDSLRGLLPCQDEYTKLRQYLIRYREIAARGGWPVIPEGKKLRKGEPDGRVILLRERLVIGGYLSPGQRNSEKLFDAALEQAVIRFQKQHGLDADGIAGRRTLKELNGSAGERARQIELNMERLRWLSGNLGQRYIKVNIADFTLDVVEANRNILRMKVVVGKPFWHTPVFSETMRYLVLNPQWNVPKSIALEEVIPKVQKNPDYLGRQNMKVLMGRGGEEEEIDPATIQWADMNGETFRYRFRQESGPRNPLGTIKFMFPNRFGVYLHDTPSKRLFERSVRSFSHGCIRLEKPLDLAEYVMKKDPKWTRERIVLEIKKGEKKEVRLPDPVNVHILYLTAWVDEDGLLHFRDDIYGRDAKLDEAMKKHPPLL
ncbi:MAG: L,D-transpeptidase family protein [Thermodesulfovibrionales bacterium]|nr:L,D-transpeptidase family protein [Thermodesulfovibrionales bacterium]